MNYSGVAFFGESLCQYSIGEPRARVLVLSSSKGSEEDQFVFGMKTSGLSGFPLTVSCWECRHLRTCVATKLLVAALSRRYDR
jgi:hypothetical protein